MKRRSPGERGKPGGDRGGRLFLRGKDEPIVSPKEAIQSEGSKTTCFFSAQSKSV